MHFSAPLSRIIRQPLPVRTGPMKERTKKVREREKRGPVLDFRTTGSHKLEHREV